MLNRSKAEMRVSQGKGRAGHTFVYADMCAWQDEGTRSHRLQQQMPARADA